MYRERETQRVGTLVIGAGQAGLSVGYHLARHGLPFLIVDAGARVGDAWRNRWDALRLFTPARYDGLAGLPFPAPGGSFPTKDEMADYLEAYARHFDLAVRTGVRIESLTRRNGRFVATAEAGRFEADSVVVAMSSHQAPRTPAFASQLDPEIVQIHSCNYRNPGNLAPGGVLVVGVGNSGADIALEVARTHPTCLSGKESGAIPFRIEKGLYRNGVVRLFRFLGHRILSAGTPIGRKLRPAMRRRAAPLIRVKPGDLSAAGIERVDRVAGVRDGLPLLADGRVVDVRNVIWCTGSVPSFTWMQFPIFDELGEPRHERGVVTEVPGLYVVGLTFLYAMTSATITGVGRDAAYVVNAIRSRRAAPRAVDERRVVPAA
jgi:putative flavoprotein involved in K+ transport